MFKEEITETEIINEVGQQHKKERNTHSRQKSTNKADSSASRHCYQLINSEDKKKGVQK